MAPPGTGKTLIAKAIAGETDSKFIVVSGSDFSEMYVGVGASRVRKLFAKARANSPSIIFIDEIDALARTRSNSRFGSQDKDNTLNRLLTELDGFSVNDKVMVFGATNRLDVLDKALLRPGRFDRKIRFSLPEKDDRFKIFNHYLSKMQLDEEAKTLCEALTKQSCGFSCADIANICNEASILAVRDKNTKVKRCYLESALDYVILGPEKKSFALSNKEKRIVAFHEAGHAVTALIIKDASDPIKISIMPRGKSALGFTQSENNSNKLRSKNELFAQMCVLLGGRVSEELNCSDITTGACDDIRKLTNLARQYVCTFGMASDIGIVCCPDDDKCSEMLKIKIDNCIQSLIKDAYKNTKKILTKNQKMVEHLTEKLLNAETLYQRDLNIELLKV